MRGLRGRGFSVLALVLGFALAAASCVGGGPATTSASGRVVTPSIGSSVPAAGADWPMYGHDPSRSAVAPSTPPAGSPKLVWRSPALDGAAYAQPLLAGRLVVAATENDSVYALSIRSGQVVWRTHLGDPMPGTSLPCGNIDPSGITGTPAIDTDTGTVYAVAFLKPGRHELTALDLATGRVRFREPIDPPGSDPLVEQQRGALNLADGNVYVPFGGLFGDCGQYHGWVASAPASGPGAISSYQVPTGREGGIWAPAGPVLGPDRDLFVATGNSASTTTFDFGESVIRLTPDLHEDGFFAPSNWQHLNSGDTDLGSVSPTVLGGDLLLQVGKEGVGYLLQASRLGGIGGELFSRPVCSAAFGATARSGSLVFVSCTDGLVALRLESPGPSFHVAWRSPSFQAGPPVVAGGAVWSIDIVSGRLNAFRARDGHPIGQAEAGSVTHFAAPAATGGFILVPATDQIEAFSGA